MFTFHCRPTGMILTLLWLKQGAMLEWKEIVTIIKGRLGLYQHEQDPAGP